MSMADIHAAIGKRLHSIPEIETIVADRIWSNAIPQATPQRPRVIPAIMWICPVKNFHLNLKGKKTGAGAGTFIFTAFHEDCDHLEVLLELIENSLTGFLDTIGGVTFTSFFLESIRTCNPIWDEDRQAWLADRQFHVAWQEARN